MAKILADEGQATAASFICAAFPGRNSRSGRGQLVSPDGERWTLNAEPEPAVVASCKIHAHVCASFLDISQRRRRHRRCQGQSCNAFVRTAADPLQPSSLRDPTSATSRPSAAFRFQSQLQFRVASVSHPMSDTTHRYVSSIHETLQKKIKLMLNNYFFYFLRINSFSVVIQ